MRVFVLLRLVFINCSVHVIVHQVQNGVCCRNLLLIDICLMNTIKRIRIASNSSTSIEKKKVSVYTQSTTCVVVSYCAVIVSKMRMLNQTSNCILMDCRREGLCENAKEFGRHNGAMEEAESGADKSRDDVERSHSELVSLLVMCRPYSGWLCRNRVCVENSVEWSEGEH
jgi:hypothetical protein